MKKKISILGLVLILVLGFTGCGSKSDATEYDKEEMELQAEFIIKLFNDGIKEEGIESLNSMTDLQLNLFLIQDLGLQTEPDDFLTMIDAWQAGKEECGAYIDHDDFELEETNEGATLTAQADFEDRDGTIEFAFDENMVMESLTVSAEYSTGEVLEKAGLNTILGMGTVFVVLIFISFIISLFGLIPAITKKFRKNVKTETVTTAEQASSVSNDTVETSDPQDEELTAVIAAAVAASEGTSTDGFIVRSIKRRKSNKWN